MVKQQSILDQVTLVYPIVSIWSGTAKVRRLEDLKNIAGQMPPTELVSDGVKHLIKNIELAPLLCVRKGITRELGKIGVAMCGGFLIPTQSVQSAMVLVAEQEVLFQTRLDALIADLPRLYSEQEQSFPEWAELLKPYQIDAAQVRSRCTFSVAAFKLNEPTVAAAANVFHAAESAVVNSLLEEIAKEAKRIRKTVFLGEIQIGQRGIPSIRRLIAKLDSFSFVDPRVYPLCKAMQAMLKQLPKRGDLSPTETASLDGMLCLLTDTETVLDHGAAVLSNGQPMQTDIEDAAISGSSESNELEDESITVETTHVSPPTLVNPAPSMNWSESCLF